MERLVSPNGVTVEAHDDAVQNLLDMGFKRAEAEKTKATTRTRAAKPKES